MRLFVSSIVLLLAGCAGFNTNLPTRCPRDGDLLEIVGSGLGQDSKGKYDVVVLRCVRLSCQNTIWTTNYYELTPAVTAKAKLAPAPGSVTVTPVFIYKPVFVNPPKK